MSTCSAETQMTRFFGKGSLENPSSAIDYTTYEQATELPQSAGMKFISIRPVPINSGKNCDTISFMPISVRCWCRTPLCNCSEIASTIMGALWACHSKLLYFNTWCALRSDHSVREAHLEADLNVGANRRPSSYFMCSESWGQWYLMTAYGIVSAPPATLMWTYRRPQIDTWDRLLSAWPTHVDISGQSRHS